MQPKVAKTMRSNEISLFLAFCIEQYKQRHNLTGENVIKLFDEKGLSECKNNISEQIEQFKERVMDEFVAQRKPVTQDNLYLLLPFKVSWVADMLSADEHISTIEAIRRVYSSAMYKQLEQESTKRWHEGPVSLYQTI